MTPSEYVQADFGNFSDLLQMQAALHPDKIAVADEERAIAYRDFDRLVDRIAAALQRDGCGHGQVAAVCASSSVEYAAMFAGTVRAGAAVAPLSPSSTPEQLADMVADCGASHLFTDEGVARQLLPVAERIAALRVALDGSASAGEPLAAWLAPEDAAPAPVAVRPEDPFNIIYSSGTTGTPKGIVQSHAHRWPHLGRTDPPGSGPDAVVLISTPLYSNTTLVSFLPALAGGGTAVLMRKFDARRFLELSQQHRATHAMLVPVQYRRILEHPDFDRFDLSSFRLKYATSAPFSAELKREVLRRWPGGLIEYYGMTEGGGSCALLAHQHPDKLHTVGKAIPGHDVRVIDADGAELPPGEVGEVVGRSPSMMNGYHNQPGKTAETEWRDASGARFIRTGDLGSFDADGFLTLVGRAKDMIISGGINIYPSDLEDALRDHPAVADVAVVGAPSREWGETPVAFVVLRGPADAEDLRSHANARLGKMQRISAVRLVDELPRSAIGKVLKRELTERLAREAG